MLIFESERSLRRMADRLKLAELTQNVFELPQKISVGYALQLVKLRPGQQEQALAACLKKMECRWAEAKLIRPLHPYVRSVVDRLYLLESGLLHAFRVRQPRSWTLH